MCPCSTSCFFGDTEDCKEKAKLKYPIAIFFSCEQLNILKEHWAQFRMFVESLIICLVGFNIRNLFGPLGALPWYTLSTLR